MKKTAGKWLRILRAVLFIFLALVLLILLTRAIGMAVNRITPNGGINRSLYVEINGTKQWINIYGKDRNNPVLLYLHGGPGSSTSDIDYAFTRKWADVYTVVTWDQRNCGKSYSEDQNDVALTYELFLSDGMEMTEFLLKLLSKDKLTILGHSWGSVFGANLVLENPEYYDCFIGTGQLVDYAENEEAFRQEALLWAQDDPESLQLVQQLTPDRITKTHNSARNKLMEKYGYDRLAGGTDYSPDLAAFFNPHYTLADWCRHDKIDMAPYWDFMTSGEFDRFSLKDRTEYRVAFYNINGDRDYQTNFRLAQNYFDRITAPYKKLYLMENMTHGLLESRSEEFSNILHEIAETESKRP